jgi:hypothetical protein
MAVSISFASLTKNSVADADPCRIMIRHADATGIILIWCMGRQLYDLEVFEPVR